MPDNSESITFYQVRRKGDGDVDYFVVPTDGGFQNAYSYDPHDANSALGCADRLNRDEANVPDYAWVMEITETRLTPPAGLVMS